MIAEALKRLVCLLGACSLVTGLPKGSYSGYRKACWPVRDPDRQTVHAKVSWLLEKHNVSTAWLPIRDFSLNGFRWLDGTYYRDRISTDPQWVKPWMNCAVFYGRDKVLDEVACSTSYSHAICQRFGDNCLGQQPCLNYTARGYNLIQGKFTWYQAKETCEKRGQQLASFPKRDMDHLLKEIIGSSTSAITIWVGLRNSEFKLDLGNNLSADIKHYHWGAGSPCECSGRDCVVVERQRDGSVQWRNTNCSETHVYLCQQDIDSVPLETFTAQPDDSPGLSWIRANWVLLLGVGIGFIVLLVAITVCIVCLVRRKRKGAEKKQRKIQNRELPEKPSQPEEVSLVENPRYDKKETQNFIYHGKPSQAMDEYEDITSYPPDLMHDLPPISVRMKEIEDMEDYYEDYDTDKKNLNDILNRKSPSVEEVEKFKQMMKEGKEISEPCFEWLVKELNGELNVRRETRYFMQISLDFHPKNIDEMRDQFGEWDYGLVGIYRWRARGSMTATHAWEEIVKIIQSGGNFLLQRWLKNISS